MIAMRRLPQLFVSATGYKSSLTRALIELVERSIQFCIDSRLYKKIDANAVGGVTETPTEMRKRSPKKSSGSSGSKNKTSNDSGASRIGEAMGTGYVLGMVTMGQILGALLWWI
ncbi:MAG: hypothetical protein Q9190_000353 [Brigantiaea leucoxantha]